MAQAIEVLKTSVCREKFIGTNECSAEPYGSTFKANAQLHKSSEDFLFDLAGHAWLPCTAKAWRMGVGVVWEGAVLSRAFVEAHPTSNRIVFGDQSL